MDDRWRITAAVEALLVKHCEGGEPLPDSI